jgi:protein-S-isoprenylcysteine O-methyltransferase Ste14
MNTTFSQVALLASLLTFALLGLVLPMVRHRITHGEGTGLMLARLTDPVSKVVGVAMACQNAAVTTYALLYLVLDPRTLHVWVDTPLFRPRFGVALMALATLVVVVGQAQMGKSWRMCVDDAKRTELVTTGVFGFSRNPLYSASNLLLVGVLLLSPSPWTVSLLATGYLLVSLQTRLEEAHMLALHGKTYRAYAARVGRFVPGLGLMPLNERD